MSNSFKLAELKPLLRNNLFLDLDEYFLKNSQQEGWVCDFLGMRLASVFQPILRLNGTVHGREALLRASLFEQGKFKPATAFAQTFEFVRFFSCNSWTTAFSRLMSHMQKTANQCSFSCFVIHISLTKLRAYPLTGISDV